MKFIISLIISLTCTLSYSQITGRVETSDSQPVLFANVIVLTTSDSSLVKGTTTDETGNFSLERITGGTYILRLSAVGYKTTTLPAFTVSGQSSVNFGVIIMEEDSQQLDEVVIKAEKPVYEQQIDRTVINVAGSVMTKGSTALQVLERSPGVFIDMRNSAIAMNGKSGVMVMLNGKLMRLPMSQLVAMLNTMSANDIEKIELLPTPPSKYDSDGNAGMINIVTKKNSVIGTSGSFSVSGGYGWREKGSMSLSLQKNTGNVSTYGSLSFLRDRVRDGWGALSTQNMPALGGHLTANVTSITEASSNSQNASFGVDVRSGKINYGGSVTMNGSIIDRHIYNDASYTLFESDSILVQRSQVTGRSRWLNTIASVYAERAFGTGSKLNVDIDYLDYRNESPIKVSNVFTNADGDESLPAGSIFVNTQRGVARSPISVGVVKSDFTKSFDPRLKLDVGVKGTFTQSNGSSTTENLTDEGWSGTARLSNKISMHETILAAYSSLNFQLTPSVTLVAGGRYEQSHTWTEADKEENQLHRHLRKFFPNVVVSKKWNDHSDIQLSWTQRISRPSYNDLASNIVYTDPMSALSGNPVLRPTITNSMRVGYNYKGYLVSLIASRDDYPIVRYQLTENAAGDLMLVGPQNMRYQDNLNVSTTIPVRIARWWNMSYGFTGGVRKFSETFTKTPVTKTYFAYNFNGSQTFTLPKNFAVEVSGWYNSRQYDGSKSITGFGMLNVGIRKEFSRNGGSLQLALTDVLQSMRLINRYGLLAEEAFSVQSFVPYKGESARYRVFRITYTKTFGNSVARTKRSVSKDENDRIRKD